MRLAALALLLMTAPAFAGDGLTFPAHFQGQWETDPTNCSGGASTGTGLFIGLDSIEYVNWATEGGNCYANSVAETQSGVLFSGVCGAEEAMPSAPFAALAKIEGDTLTFETTGPFIDTYHRCEAE